MLTICKAAVSVVRDTTSRYHSYMHTLTFSTRKCVHPQGRCYIVWDSMPIDQAFLESLDSCAGWDTAGREGRITPGLGIHPCKYPRPVWSACVCNAPAPWPSQNWLSSLHWIWGFQSISSLPTITAACPCVPGGAHLASQGCARLQTWPIRWLCLTELSRRTCSQGAPMVFS